MEEEIEMKMIFVVLVIFATVMPVAMAQETEKKVEVGFAEKVDVVQYCNVPPRSAVAKQPAAKAVKPPPVPTPKFVWPETTTLLGGALVLMGLVTAFLLGRVTAHNPNPQVVYVQPVQPPHV